MHCTAGLCHFQTQLPKPCNLALVWLSCCPVCCSADAPACSHTAAINQRVAEACSLSELLDAANEHLRLAEQGSGIKLDIGRIARLHKMGKQWRDETSARSHGSNTGSSGSSRGADSCRSDTTVTTSRTTDSSSLMHSSRQPTCVVSRPIGPGGAIAAAVAPAQWQVQDAAAAARGSASSSSNRSSTHSAHGPSGHEQHPQAAPGSQRRTSCLGSQQVSTSTITASTSTASVPSAAAAQAGPAATQPADSTRSQHSSRLPPPMKLAPPTLQQPTAAELGALPMPSLPQLLDLSHEPVKVLQARLERVWDALGIPAEEQLDMVLR